ncbi:MAG: NUDIX hydrolase [Mucilaginibacter sp.]|nr:NUDIX hydrolase [Mucilaginibacter sp.]
MRSIEEFRNFFLKGYLDYRPNLVVDCAIFGYDCEHLLVLLVKDKIVTKWCLPGGYIRKEENLEQAAARVTNERTGIDNLFLKQFKTFGDVGRNCNKGSWDESKLEELAGIKVDGDNWLNGETASVGFYAVTDILNAQPSIDFLSSECRWFPVNEVPLLGFDHDDMLKEALRAMRMHLYHYPIGKALLQQKFTLKDIKQLYETLSGKKLNPTNFPVKLQSLGLLTKLSEKKSIGGHRSPTYYKFDNEAYEKALNEGLVLV